MLEQVGNSPAVPEAPRSGQLLDSESLSALRSEWDAIQVLFVDDPRSAVVRADELLVRAFTVVSNAIARDRAEIHERWARDANTEDLRIAMQRYRWHLRSLLGF
jgi:hypothetical protein